MASLIPAIVNLAVGAVTTAATIVTSTAGAIWSNVIAPTAGAIWEGAVNVGTEIWEGATEAYDWVSSVADGEALQNLYGAVDIGANLYAMKKQRDAIKDLENFELDIPAMDDFEAMRDEMFDILDTDPNELTSSFDEATLRKYGLDPDTVDAETMIRKRGARAQFERNRDALSRQFARSGATGSAALATAQAQLGIQGAAYDAQLGYEAEQKFTEQISGLQDRYQKTTEGMMTMETQLANWEWQRQQEIAKLEGDFMADVTDFTGKLATWEPDTPQTTTSPTGQTGTEGAGGGFIGGGGGFFDQELPNYDSDWQLYPEEEEALRFSLNPQGLPDGYTQDWQFQSGGRVPPGPGLPEVGTRPGPYGREREGQIQDFNLFDRDLPADPNVPGMDLGNQFGPRDPNVPGMNDMFMTEEDRRAAEEARARMGF